MLLRMETFDGTFEKWPVFWRGFYYEVNSNDDLDDSWKHRMLFQLLVGPAKESMLALETTRPCTKRR